MCLDKKHSVKTVTVLRLNTKPHFAKVRSRTEINLDHFFGVVQQML